MNDRLKMSAVALEPVERCPLCDAAERTLFERAASPPEQIHLMRCEQCGFIYTDAVVAADHIPRFYAGYNATRDTERADLREKRVRMYEIDAAYARRYLRTDVSRVLDIGSGTGDFLVQFADEFELHGVEVDAAARAACVGAYPSLLLYPDLEAIPGNITFDAIFFRGTLQSMPDLHGLVAWCCERLRSDGHLFVLATPNAESLLAQLQRESWVLANKVEQRYWFTRRHLIQLFGERFSLMDYELPYLGTPYEDYPNDLRRVLAMVDNPEARKGDVAFFGSMMSVVLRRL